MLCISACRDICTGCRLPRAMLRRPIGEQLIVGLFCSFFGVLLACFSGLSMLTFAAYWYLAFVLQCWLSPECALFVLAGVFACVRPNRLAVSPPLQCCDLPYTALYCSNTRLWYTVIIVASVKVSLYCIWICVDIFISICIHTHMHICGVHAHIASFVRRTLYMFIARK